MTDTLVQYFDCTTLSILLLIAFAVHGSDYDLQVSSGLLHGPVEFEIEIEFEIFLQGGSERARWEEVVEREWVGGSKMRGDGGREVVGGSRWMVER